MTKSELTYVEESLDKLKELKEFKEKLTDSKLVIYKDSLVNEIPKDFEKRVHAILESEVNRSIMDVETSLHRFTGTYEEIIWEG